MQQLKSMASDRKLANAIGGKTARACDNCVRKRARWYCAADDAFLCQSCDSSVHSANSLARRHERVRLKVSPINSFDGDGDEYRNRLLVSVPSWHQGFTRKARTPRQKKHGKLMTMTNPLHLVPEICSEEQSHEENEEQLLYRVPIFDPFEVAANPAAQNDAENTHRFVNESKAASNNEFGQEMKLLEGTLPSELDLAEFAADVESLLGKGLDDESFDMEGLGILDCDENGKESKVCSLLSERIKVEDEEVGEVDVAEENHQIDLKLDVGRETFALSFDYGSPITFEKEEEENKALIQEPIFKNKFEECEVNNDYKSFLKLDYEGVMSAWDDQKSPWTTGERPELNSGDCWPDSLGTSGTMHAYGDMGMMSGHAAAAAAAAMADGGREARVSRYREKRRTRLFSKKIRYEVRKLNAEKRPRMKGRFVKRANFAASAFPLLK